jgi:hypothetical protein
MDEAIRTAAISPLRQRLIDDYEHAPVLARDATQLHSGRGALLRHSSGVHPIQRRRMTCADYRSNNAMQAYRRRP